MLLAAMQSLIRYKLDYLLLRMLWIQDLKILRIRVDPDLENSRGIRASNEELSSMRMLSTPSNLYSDSTRND
ncbi:hypothetical protein AAHA92_25209 [Salvia divinorum]|uniref:Uncharacterized protein n=1 Tax=Salvia divinorum TaxID=28513 RepID=A0ABD1GA06_SALDI